MRFYIASAVLLSVFAAGWLTLFNWHAAPKQMTPPEKLTIEKSIDMAGQFLLSRIHDDGKFLYITGTDGLAAHEEKYNLLRHAGAIYALANFEKTHPGDFIRDRVQLATDFLVKNAVLPVEGGNQLRAIFSVPELTHRKESVAALGGTGLGLVAILENEAFAKGTVDASVIRDLGAFLLFMQKPNGEFYSKFTPGSQGRGSDFQSLYYPGEALLGLTHLYLWDHQTKWFEAAVKGLRFLATARQAAGDAPPDNWAMVATEEIFSIAAAPASAVRLSDADRDLFLNHAEQVAKADLRGQISDPLLGAVRGGFMLDGRTTPTATRLEGLLSITAFAPTDRLYLHTTLEMPERLAIEFLQRSQVRDGALAGGIPKAIASASAPAEAAEVRIDYVQHALSAFLRYAALTKHAN